MKLSYKIYLIHLLLNLAFICLMNKSKHLLYGYEKI